MPNPLFASDNPPYFILPAEVPEGQWKEHRLLASAVRDLNTAIISTHPSEEALKELRAKIESITAEIYTHPKKTYGEAFRDGTLQDNPLIFIDRGAQAGHCNPAAPPVTVLPGEDEVVGFATFGMQFEGAPGHVHGGSLAAAFDQIVGYTQAYRGVACMTGGLNIRYLAPTPLYKEVRFFGTVTAIDGRKTTIEARSQVGDTVTARAEAIMITIGDHRFKDLAEKRV